MLVGTQDGQDALKMAAASINEETHRETQQTRTETQEKQRKSFISDRAEWSEARPPPLPKGPKDPATSHAHRCTYTHTHTHADAQTNRHTSDTRRHAKTRKVSFFAFWETCKEGFILLRASRSFAKTGFVWVVFPYVLQCFLHPGGHNFNMLLSWPS